MAGMAATFPAMASGTIGELSGLVLMARSPLVRLARLVSWSHGLIYRDGLLFANLPLTSLVIGSVEHTEATILQFITGHRGTIRELCNFINRDAD
jgi:uncharacterized membrane protein (DUF4010 family)